MHLLMSRYYGDDEQGTEPGEEEGLLEKARRMLIFAFYKAMISPHSLGHYFELFGSGIPDMMNPGWRCGVIVTS
jgi:hypothetical protein